MIVESKDLDKKAWDDFVLREGGTVFSSSVYLDSTAENWCVYWKQNENWGVALPYTFRMGVKTLYQPFFSRYQEVIGEVKEGAECLEDILKKYFKRSLASFRREIPDWLPSEIYVYQKFSTQGKVSTNAKRQLKKFEKSAYQIVDEDFTKSHLNFIIEKLSDKLSFYKGPEMELLNCLTENLNIEGSLQCKVVRINGEIAACVLLMNAAQRCIYLKGASSEDLKKLGAMYALLHQSQVEALNENKLFDFGGSRVESVKSFNYKLGGVDQKYFAYHYDNSPFWFKLAQRIKAWKKK